MSATKFPRPSASYASLVLLITLAACGGSKEPGPASGEDAAADAASVADAPGDAPADASTQADLPWSDAGADLPSDLVADDVVPDVAEDSVVPDAAEDGVVLDAAEDSAAPETMQDSVVAETVEDGVALDVVTDVVVPDATAGDVVLDVLTDVLSDALTDAAPVVDVVTDADAVAVTDILEDGDAAVLTDTIAPPNDTQPDALVPTGEVSVQAVGSDGAPIVGAQVVLGAVTQPTDAQGLTLFTAVPQGPAVVLVEAPGFASASRSITVEGGKTVSVVVTLSTVQVTKVVSSDNAAVVTTPSVAIDLPAAAFVLADGTPVTGAIKVEVAPLDPTQQSLGGAPGALVGVPTGGSSAQPLDALFLADVSFTQNGKPLSLAAGKTATLTFQVPAALSGTVTVGQTLGAWYYDLETASWLQDGQGTIAVDGNGTKTFTATVSHFTWWMGAIPAVASGCLKVTVNKAGQPQAGVALQAEGVSYNGVSQATTGADGSACLEVSASATVNVSVQDAVLTQLGGPQQVVADATVLACSADAAGCKLVTVNVQAPTGCAVDPGVCDDQNACTTESCDPATGVCSHGFANGQSCDDALTCTTADTCLAGACAGTPLDCNDGDACTADNCVEGAGCTQTVTTAPCNDGNACTVDDVCTAGTCAGTAKDCGDQNTCTTDSCGAAGTCHHAATSGACDDGDACTTGDACTAGACAGATKDCDDQNTCTTDTCGAAGTCQHAATSGACDDGDACTTGDACASGTCQGAKSACDDQNACTDDTCDAALGCTSVTVADNTACTFGDLCSSGHVCMSGVCVGPNQATMPAGMVLIPPGSFMMGCVPSECPGGSLPYNGGAFSGELPRHKVTLDGYYMDVLEVSVAKYQACFAAGFCTVPAKGEGGGNTGGTCNWGVAGKEQHPVNCVTWSQSAAYCAWAGSRLPTEAEWERAARGGLEGLIYPWGNSAATGTENLTPCTDGYCQTAPVGSFAANPFGLHDIGGNVSEFVSDWLNYDYYAQSPSKNPKGGADTGMGHVFRGGKWADYMQFNISRASGRPVDDPPAAKADVGFRCARTFVAPIASCDDQNGCTADSCGTNGVCVHAPVSGTCDDDNACTAGDACQAGTCAAGAAVNCNDGNACTVDSCLNTMGCLNEVDDASTCDDTDACTSNDYCEAGTCYGTPKDCGDNNPCTLDSCDPLTTVCANTAAPGSCDVDGTLCTLDTCQGGACLPGSVTTCDDNNICTVDACTSKFGNCSHTATGNGNDCDDGDPCTTASACASGVCSGSAFKDCDDGNVCTADACDKATANCVHTAAAGSCEADGSQCTPDACQASTCVKGAVISCDDNDACTIDSCVPETGLCDHTPDPAPCDDGNDCTYEECVGTGCTYETLDGDLCDLDGDGCTGDICKGTTCTTTAKPTDCNDVNPCTTDSCISPGGCSHASLPDGTACSDGLGCTTGDICSGGYCGSDVIACPAGQFCAVGACADASAAGTAYIPGGESDWSQLGCVAGDAQCAPDEKTPSGVAIGWSPTFMGVNEVTTAEYAACVTAGDCTVPETAVGGCNWGVSGKEQYPIDCVTFSQAQTYCQWVGGHLPSEVDWEVAARGGVAGKLYPWGDAAPDCAHAMTPNCGGGATAAVASKPAGQNPYGLNDMAGNAQEWTSDAYSPDFGTTYPSWDDMAVRGGGGDVLDLRISHRSHVLRSVAKPALGMRCAWTPYGPTFCDDGNWCTDDAFGAAGCVHTPTTKGCNDGNYCTVKDTCSGGACVGTPRICDDLNPCTVESCDPVLYCTSTPVTNSATCCNGVPATCDDGNTCTTDTCDSIQGCTNTALPNNSACDDGSACTASDYCDNLVCKGKALYCSDRDACTTDACDPKTGCTHVFAAGGSCVCQPNCAGKACGADGCGGWCGSGPKDCNDGNNCTADSCNPSIGCVNTAQSCDDGNTCTADSCVLGGACSNEKIDNGATCCSGAPCGVACKQCQFEVLAGNDVISFTCAGGGAAVMFNRVGPAGSAGSDGAAGGACEAGQSGGLGGLGSFPNIVALVGTGCTVKELDANTLEIAYTCGDATTKTTITRGANGSPGKVGANGAGYPGCMACASAADCDDNNPCTTDTCDGANLCAHANNTATCLGGTCAAGKCTTATASAGSCSHAKCESGSALDAGCDACVAKVCDVDAYCCNVGWDSKCVAEVLSTCKTYCTCTPDCTGKACGSNGCGGWCGSGPLNCDDAKVCTDDSCDPATGCKFVNNTAACNGGTCAAGACVPTACSHSFCTTGAALVSNCDPCVMATCMLSPSCCTTSWTAQCTAMLPFSCSQSCP